MNVQYFKKGQIWYYGNGAKDEQTALMGLTNGNGTPLIYPNRPFLIWQTNAIFPGVIYGMALTHSDHWKYGYKLEGPEANRDSYVRIDQLRPLHLSNLNTYLGTISDEAIRDIDNALDYVFGRGEMPKWMQDVDSIVFQVPASTEDSKSIKVENASEPEDKLEYPKIRGFNNGIRINWDKLSFEELKTLQTGDPEEIKELFGISITEYYRKKSEKILKKHPEIIPHPLSIETIRQTVETEPRRVLCIGKEYLVANFGFSPDVADSILRKAKKKLPSVKRSMSRK